MAETRQGVFIAVEGGDGAGKGSLIARLVAAFEAQGRAVVATREPGGAPEGEALRALLLSSKGEWDPRSELLLMTAARVQHVERVVKPALARGAVVVTDRYVGSTIAYQGAGRGLAVELIFTLHDAFVGLWPDLTLTLDVDAEIGLARAKRRLAADAVDEGRFEGLDAAFHSRVRRSFLEQARGRPDTHAVIDASRTQDEVFHDALAAIDALLAREAAKAPA